MTNFKLLLILILFVSLTEFTFGQTGTTYSHPATDDEFVGPFPSWLNVKTQFGAVGDGVHDDTQAIQAAFDAVGGDDILNVVNSVVYLPAGTYLVTSTLQLKGKVFIGIIGSDPATTVIKWGGPQFGRMLVINGIAHSRLNRISFDGNNTARYAIDDSWDGLQNYFDTGNEFADDVFTNVEFGIHGGFAYGVSFAETTIIRCKFIHNTVAGVSLGNFNALDAWVWNSLFEDCGIGVTNNVESGAGQFKVYNSVFRRSVIADITIGNTGQFSFRDNTSTGSKSFITAILSANACSIIMQGNKIIDPLDGAPVFIQNQGQLTFIDNIIRSRPDAVGPAVVISAPPNSEFFAVGNTFTVNNPIASNRSIIYNTSIVSAQSLSTLGEQVLPGTEVNLNRTIFEVPRGTNSAVIQGIIKMASALQGSRPIIHFPPGIYQIDTTIALPAGSDIQLVGDAYTSILSWDSNTPKNSKPIILEIEGPTKATIRDMQLRGSQIANGILVKNCDQVGSRIFTHVSQLNKNGINYLVNALDNTTVMLTNINYSAASTGISVIGGPAAEAGNPFTGKTVVYAGSSSDNDLSLKVEKGGNLLVRDTWYESEFVNQYANLPGAGIFSSEGNHIANTNANVTAPQISMSNFSGKATYLGNFLSDRIAVNDNGTKTSLLALGMTTQLDTYITDNTSHTADIRAFNSRSSQFIQVGTGSNAVPDIGSPDESFILPMLETIRNTHASLLTPLPAKITDARFYRVSVEIAPVGMEFSRMPDAGETSALPVTITSFMAIRSGAAIQVRWTTQQEINIDHYEVEKSADGVHFSTAGTVQAKNAGSSLSENYQWPDTSPLEGKNYYRLKIIEQSGTFRYTNIVVVQMGNESEGVSVYPNPVVDDKFTIELRNVPAGNYVAKLFNSNGQIVLTKNVTRVAGVASQQITVTIHLPKGNYFLMVTGDKSSYTRKLII